MLRNFSTLIFDLDGTLIKFPEGNFKESKFFERILNNAETFLSSELNFSKDKSKYEIKKLKEKYGEELSVGVEEIFGIKREIFLNQVWDIKDESFVKANRGLRDVLLDLNSRYSLFIISDAPKVWINFVLNKISIQDIFQNKIFSGESNYRKSIKNAFSFFINKNKIEPKECISIGDQEDTDIIPANKLGMGTVLVNRKKVKSRADLIVNEIEDLIKYL